MESTEQAYKDQIKDLEQQILLLKEQVDFLTRKLYGTKSEKTSLLQIEGQMSLFNEIETNADPDAPEPQLVEVEKHLRRKKYSGQKEELLKNLPYHKVLHTIDESERTCETCDMQMVRVGEEFVRTEIQFIPAKLKSLTTIVRPINAVPAVKMDKKQWKKHQFHILRLCTPCISIYNLMADSSEV